ncbi:hypothetical protein [Streptomyces albogriseolus]|uniref:hypothetical protein n=1 Tax=Streptomyces albogriseolus TaxID=1887 RepID=UPI003460A093
MRSAVTGIPSAGDSGPAAALTGKASTEAIVKRPAACARDGAFGGGLGLDWLMWEIHDQVDVWPDTRDI